MGYGMKAYCGWLGDGMSSNCKPRVQLFADAGNGWPHSANFYLFTNTYRWGRLVSDRNRPKASPSDVTWCKLSMTTTRGAEHQLAPKVTSQAAAEHAHWSTTLVRYCRNSRLDCWSMLNVAIISAFNSDDDFTHLRPPDSQTLSSDLS